MKTRCILTLVCAVVTCTPFLMADEGQPLTNGTFDTDLAAWSIDPAGSNGAIWYDQSALFCNPGDFPINQYWAFSTTAFPFSLANPSFTGPNIEYSSLYQYLQLPANADMLSFDVTMEVYNHISAGGETDYFEMTIWHGPGYTESQMVPVLSSNQAESLHNLLDETDYDGMFFTHHVIHNITSTQDVSAWAGQNIILEFKLDHDLYDDILTAVTLDDVAISEAGDVTPPAVTVGEMIELWPPNHKYRTFQLSDCVLSVDDGDGGELNIDEVGTIVSISSDEPEDVQGRGDGNFLNDMIILNNNTFLVRAERQGKGNGRVYAVNFMVQDLAGNITEATVYLGVPHDQSGKNPIVDDGPAAGYTIYAP